MWKVTWLQVDVHGDTHKMVAIMQTETKARLLNDALSRSLEDIRGLKEVEEIK
jgi:hypothetical protein